MYSTDTKHTARLVDRGSIVTWLPGKTLTRNEAITAMTIAEVIGSGGTQGHNLKSGDPLRPYCTSTIGLPSYESSAPRRSAARFGAWMTRLARLAELADVVGDRARSNWVFYQLRCRPRSRQACQIDRSGVGGGHSQWPRIVGWLTSARWATKPNKDDQCAEDQHPLSVQQGKCGVFRH